MKKNVLVVIPATLVLLASFSFTIYWFSIRVEKIRKDCTEEALNVKTPITDPYIQSQLGVESISSKKEQNNHYRLCLTKNGLQPESLFVNIGE